MVLLGFLLLCAVLLFSSLFAGCCLPSLRLGGAAFTLSSDGWCCLVSFFGWCCRFFCFFGGTAFLLSSVGWCCLVHSRPASSPPPLGSVAFPISFQVVIPSFSSSGWGPRSPPPLLGGAAILHLLLVVVPLSSVGSRSLVSLHWVVSAFLPLLWVGSRFPPLLLGGAAWSPASLGGVALSLSFFCVMLPSFPSFGVGLYFFHLFCWVVLLSKIKKKRCKGKRNVKTVAKWKKEK